MATMETIGRFQLIKGSPPMLPGKCAICGTVDTDREYVDFGFELDYYGVVYFCNFCLAEMVALLGYIPTDRWKMIVDENIKLENTNEELQKQNQELKDAINHLSNLISSGSISVAIVTDVVSEDVESGSDEERGNIDTYDSDITEGEVRPIEPINESRSTDLQYNDSGLINQLLSDI